jgi:hypothetical protein
MAKDPCRKLGEVQDRVNGLALSPLSLLEMDGYANQQLIKSSKGFDDILEDKKDVLVDSVIVDLQEQLSGNSQTVKRIKENISERLRRTFTNLCNAPSLNWPLEHFEDVYTEEAFQNFEKLHQSNEILSNLIYPDPYEVPYLETLQQMNEEESKEQLEPETKTGKRYQNKSSDDIVCEVCNNGDYEDKNMIVVCSTCDLSVHQKCYGIAQVPYDDWICDACTVFGQTKRKLLRCALCPVKGGAMKPSTISINNPLFASKTSQESNDEPRPLMLWVHLSCAHWIPELELWTKNFNKSVTDLSLIDRKRFKLTCSICKQRGIGCCIQCSKGKCSVSFHVECARFNGIYLEFEANSQEASRVFCDKHRPLRLKKELEKSRKHAAEDILRFCKIVDKSITLLTSTGETLYDELKSTSRKPRIGNKLFNKMEKKKLMNRVHFISKNYGQLFISILQQPDNEFKVNPKAVRLEYVDTISKRVFPWNEVKVDAKFTSLNCYNKYISLIPDEETYKLKILGVGKERVEKEKKLKLRMHREEQKRNAVDMNKYCYCKKTVQEVASSMIGIHSLLL